MIPHAAEGQTAPTRITQTPFPRISNLISVKFLTVATPLRSEILCCRLVNRKFVIDSISSSNSTATSYPPRVRRAALKSKRFHICVSRSSLRGRESFDWNGGPSRFVIVIGDENSSIDDKQAPLNIQETRRRYFILYSVYVIRRRWKSRGVAFVCHFIFINATGGHVLVAVWGFAMKKELLSGGCFAASAPGY